jgi:YggT family protein
VIVAANVLFGLAKVLDFALSTYFFIILGSAIVSWVNADPWNPIVRFLRRATEPLYFRIRRRFPFLAAGGIDFTPLVLIGIVYFLQAALVGSLFDYALRLKSTY